MIAISGIYWYLFCDSLIFSPMKRTSLLLVLGLLLLLGGSLFAANGVAMAGQGYGHSEVKALGKWFMEVEASFPPMTVEQLEGKLDAGRFADFKVVVVASLDKAEHYTPQECEKIEEWLKGGGKLVLVHQGPKAFSTDPAKDRDQSYLFGRSFYIRNPTECSVVLPDSPMLKEVFAKGERPAWLRGNIRISGDHWTNIVGDENGLCLIGTREVGSGKVYYLGNELFRIEAGKKAEDIAAWKMVLRNVFSEALSVP